MRLPNEIGLDGAYGQRLWLNLGAQYTSLACAAIPPTHGTLGGNRRCPRCKDTKMRRIASGLKALCFSIALVGSIMPTAFAHPKKHGGAVKYKAHCGMIYSAADAKKNHYMCPMDHKPLMKMTEGSTHKRGAKGGMGGMKM